MNIRLPLPQRGFGGFLTKLASKYLVDVCKHGDPEETTGVLVAQVVLLLVLLAAVAHAVTAQAVEHLVLTQKPWLDTKLSLGR